MGEIGIPVHKYKEFIKARDECLERFAKKNYINLERLKINLKKHAENRKSQPSWIYDIDKEMM